MKSFPQILKVFLIFSLFILISSASFAQNSGVDYVRQVATATGIGAPNPNMPAAVQRPSALRAAKADAYRNLLEVIKGVRLNSETTVENFMVQSDYIHTQVEGVLQGFTVVDQQYMSDGTVEVTVEIPLTGDLAEVLLPPEKFGEGETVGMPTEPAPTQGNVFSGLIIDARGLGVQPAMAPKVLNESGSEVYGTGFVSREYAVQMGVVGYSKSPDQAKTDERTGDNPYIVKATRVEGPNKTDVVITDKDAGVIHGMAENLNFLEQAKVIIVID